MKLHLFNESNAPNNRIFLRPMANQTEVYGQPIIFWSNRLAHINDGVLKEMHRYMK